MGDAGQRERRWRWSGRPRTERGPWSGEERRRGNAPTVDPRLRALLDDLARMDGVVVPGPTAAPAPPSAEVPDPPADDASPATAGGGAEVVDLASFRARRRR